jgi:hypothetical protein
MFKALQGFEQYSRHLSISYSSSHPAPSSAQIVQENYRTLNGASQQAFHSSTIAGQQHVSRYTINTCKKTCLNTIASNPKLLIFKP